MIPSSQILKLLILRFSWRHAKNAPSSTLALIAIVALGVAVFFSVRLSNKAAVAGFGLFTESISGGSDFLVTGSGQMVREDRLRELRSALNPLPVMLMPVIEGTASFPGTGDQDDDFDAVQIPVLGIDLLAARNLAYVRESIQNIPFEEDEANRIELGHIDEAYITETMAQRQGLQQDDYYEVILGDSVRTIRVVGILKTDELQVGMDRELIIMDIPALQTLLQRRGQLDRVEVIIPDGVELSTMREEVQARLELLDSKRWTWSTSGSKRESAQTMTAAFRLNLTILSALSLLVGFYLIIQAMETAVVRRRKEIGILMSMGLEPRWIRAAWLIESLMLGAMGSGVGILLGWLMAQGAVRAVAQTVNALYVSTTTHAAAWHAGEAGLAFGLGLAATFAAGILPARDAANTPPVQTMMREDRAVGIRLLDSPRLGLVLILVGFLLSMLPALQLGQGVRFPLGGYLAAAVWLVGAAILSGNLIRFVPKFPSLFSNQNSSWRMAVSQFRQPSGRQKLTIAGLVVAIGMAAGMEILTHSFERTVGGWINQSLKADLFVAVKGIENASNRNKISEATWRKIVADPDVEKVETGHFFPIVFQDATTMLMGMRSTHEFPTERFIWAEAPRLPLDMTQSLEGGTTPVLISESFSVRFGIRRGEEITIQVPEGEQRLKVQGVYSDYGNERGAILLDGDTVCRWFDDWGAVNLAATLNKNRDAEAVRERWLREFPGLAVRTNGALRGEVFRIFHQTFAVTNALKIIGVSVAVCGLALALFSLLMDRRQQLVTMREIGMQRSGIMASVTFEGLTMTIVGVAGGLILSMALGYLLIYVINRQSFGWTLAYAVPVGGLGSLSAGVLLAATLTCLGIGRWAARLKGEISE